MKALAGQDSTDSLYPQGRHQSVKSIEVYTEEAHLATVLGIVGGFIAPMVFLTTGAVDLLDFMQWSHLTIPGSGVLGMLLVGGTATALTAKNRLRKELTESGTFTADNLSVFKMLSLKKKHTFVDMGKDAEGQEIKAIVRSSRNGISVEYLTMPSPLETWDKTAQTLIEVHELAPKSSSMVRSQP